MENKHRLIVYDIRDSKRLSKVKKIMESFGWRVQKSVFESYANESTMNLLKRNLEKVIDKTEDFVLFFEVCERDWQKQEKYGIGSKDCERMSDDRFLIL